LNAVELIVLALAVARLTRLVTTDTIFDTPREWVLKRYPNRLTTFGDSEVARGSGNVGLLETGVRVFRSSEAWHPVDPVSWSYLLSCDWCASVWMGIVVWALYLIYPVTVWVLAPLALAQFAGVILDRDQ
jgi:hypothetical protein